MSRLQFYVQKKSFQKTRHSSPNSSPKSLYLIENVNIISAIYPLTTRHPFLGVTSELALQVVLYQIDMQCEDDEWVTSATK